MEKGEKKYLITTGTIFAVGVLFFIIGIVFGGAKQCLGYIKTGGEKLLDNIGNFAGYENMEELVGTFNPYANLDFNLDDIPVEGVNIHDMDRFSVDDADSIFILTNAGDINIVKSNSNFFGLDAEGVKLRYFEKDDVIYVTSDATDATIYIPSEKEFDYFCVSTLAGDIDLSAPIKANKIDINAASGDIQVNKIISNDGQLVIGAGNLSVNEMDVESYVVTSIIGNIDIKCNVEKDLTVRGIGNIELNLAGEEKDYNYELNAKAGNVVLGSSEWSGAKLDKKIDNDSEKNIILESSTGNVEIQFY